MPHPNRVLYYNLLYTDFEPIYYDGDVEIKYFKNSGILMIMIGNILKIGNIWFEKLIYQIKNIN